LVLAQECSSCALNWARYGLSNRHSYRTSFLHPDDQDKLLFWYRNIPKQDYGIQGWRKHRVFADFIFTDKANGNGFNRVFVVETKGLHLKDNDKTTYLKKLFDLCNDRAREMTLTDLGMKLEANDISFLVVDESDWQDRFNALFAPQTTPP
jgi:type III restriction enzyme